MILPLCAALLAALSSSSSLPPTALVAGHADESDELIERVVRDGDRAAAADIVRVAELGTRRAAEALVEAYDGMATVYARREVVRALGLFDAVEDARDVALEQLFLVASTSGEAGLREEAVAVLADCGAGRPYLVRVVESPAEDEVRILALQRHAAGSDGADDEWYETIYQPEVENPIKRGKKGKKANKRREAEVEPVLAVHVLPELRAVAFEALAPRVKSAALIDALEDRAHQVRRIAFLALAERDPKAAGRAGLEMLEQLDERPENRVLAARTLAETRGERMAADFLEIGLKLDTPAELRTTLAELLASFDDDGGARKLGRMLGKSKARPYERVFALRTVCRSRKSKMTANIAKELDAEELEVRLAAIEALAVRGDPEAAAFLEEALDQAQASEVVVALVVAIAGFHGADAEWQARLAGLAGSDDDELRNVALSHLTLVSAHFDVFARALEHPRWSTRYQALRKLSAIGTREVVPLLVERMQVEDGRMQSELAAVLFQLTGQPFRTSASSWQGWWKAEGASFTVLTPEELEQARQRIAERAERQTSRAEFFGIRIESHRVIFVIDVSGSMAELLRARHVGGVGEKTRLEAAMAELTAAIDGLEANTEFNIIAFESGVTRWQEAGLAESGSVARERAKSWLRRLGPLGGTNLYDAMREAFSDLRVDTIFVLSDGEPSQGEHTDPFVIREHVRRWNAHRGVVIHAVAIGTSLDVLEWLAMDASGTYRQLR